MGQRVKDVAHFPQYVEQLSHGSHRYLLSRAEKYGEEISGFCVRVLELHGVGGYRMVQGILALAQMLIIDELGFKKFTQTGADDLFEIINRRYEKKSTIITSNKSFEDWGQVLFDPVLASAMVDRFIHHCHVITIKGNSYRSRHYKEPKKEPCSTLQASQDHL